MRYLSLNTHTPIANSIGRKNPNMRICLNPDFAVGIVDKQNFSMLSGARGLFWIGRIAE